MYILVFKLKILIGIGFRRILYEIIAKGNERKKGPRKCYVNCSNVILSWPNKYVFIYVRMLYVVLLLLVLCQIMDVYEVLHMIACENNKHTSYYIFPFDCSVDSCRP